MNARDLLTGTTPGPWEARVLSEAQADVYDAQQMTLTGYEGDFTLSAPDARLMAAAPDLAARVIALEEREAKVKALHAKGTFIFSWREGTRFDPACTECDGKAGVHPCGCYADDDESDWKCRECGPKSTYPCPTIALLDKETK